MPLSEIKLSELKVIAMQESRKIVEEIVEAYNNPHISLSGESLKIWNELDEWGWLEEFPIEDEKNQVIFRRMTAMTRFRHLRWKEEHPSSEKAKMTKWEKVVGKTRR